MGLEELILTTERKRAERRGMERGIERGIEQGMERGIERRNHQVVMNMIQHDFTDEAIIKAVAVTPDYVQKIRGSLN